MPVKNLRNFLKETPGNQPIRTEEKVDNEKVNADSKDRIWSVKDQSIKGE